MSNLLRNADVEIQPPSIKINVSHAHLALNRCRHPQTSNFSPPPRSRSFRSLQSNVHCRGAYEVHRPSTPIILISQSFLEPDTPFLSSQIRPNKPTSTTSEQPRKVLSSWLPYRNKRNSPCPRFGFAAGRRHCIVAYSRATMDIVGVPPTRARIAFSPAPSSRSFRVQRLRRRASPPQVRASLSGYLARTQTGR